ncbi:hypothetical protein [Kitasatospora sp. DSM 101779]|uniref:hypothetical protein n=1 Tax=Kitasatospora sp. DSM 101779 TaxID=2853165 RepID=UPI0021DB7177|nr:hypothetical protein [Kitasatospora sp. DSM 101779]MCU7827046.1 hypothetical protein [Kitasatospora sp. DSM 101779]
MSVWWVRRRDDLLAQLAVLLVYFGADLLEDPGTGELARTAEALAGEYRVSDRGEGIRRAAALLDEVAAHLQAADRFRGTLLPVVNRHLRCAVALLVRSRAGLETVAVTGGRSPRAEAAR